MVKWRLFLLTPQVRQSIRGSFSCDFSLQALVEKCDSRICFPVRKNNFLIRQCERVSVYENCIIVNYLEKLESIYI